MIAGKPPVGPAPSPPAPPSDGVQISQMSKNSPSHGQCLNVLAASTRDGTPIFTYPCSQGGARLELATNEHPTTRAMTGAPNDEWDTQSGLLKCMGKCATAALDGTVALYSCNGSTAQRWSTEWPLIKSGSGCLGLDTVAAPGFPHNKLVKVGTCADADPTQKWINSSASNTLNVMPAPAFVRVCGRISAFKPNGTPPQGYCLIVDSNSTWFLAEGGSPGPNGRDKPNVIATGQLPARGQRSTEAAAWLTLSLEMSGSKITPSVDGKSLGTVETDTFKHGMAAVGSGWHKSYFDDFVLKPGPSSRD